MQDLTSRLCGVGLFSACVCTHKCGRSGGELQWKELTFIAADVEQLDLCDAISAVGVTVSCVSSSSYYVTGFLFTIIFFLKLCGHVMISQSHTRVQWTRLHKSAREQK